MTHEEKGGKSLFMALRLDTDVQYLKGVGPRLGELLRRKGLSTIRDLLEFYPRAYEDRRAARSISTLKAGDVVSLKAKVHNISAIKMGRSQRKLYDITVQDSTGRIHCKFFRVPYRGYFERFRPFQDVRVVGRVVEYRGRLEFHHPDIRDVEADAEMQDTLVPIYTEIEGISSHKIMQLIRTALSQISPSDWPTDPLPASVLKRYSLPQRFEALRSLHNPDPSLAREFSDARSPAHRRIIFEEFFWMELLLAARRAGFQRESALIFCSSTKLEKKLRELLPFQLTGAQERALVEIKKDLSSGHPMHRLVQGDVGSGKTLVGFLAALQAIEGGAQACLMAPTEILAEQHFKNARRWLEPLGLRVALLVGKTKASEKKKILAQLEVGQIDFLLGTHALIEEEVRFHSLGLAIIDEQHRFGVEQRLLLKNKGKSPHFLVMTATPIPRTLAMTVYGDLDVSLIDELPPGRTPIQTRVTFQSKRPLALDFMAGQISKGRQAYIVYPLVEESEKIDLKDAVNQFEELKDRYPNIRFGLLHGRMKPEEKDAVMDSFRRHEMDVLVSTTVIEVGVDVPNATVMIIEHAERFGLSQLHQLRGRVGRGAEKSFCILILGYAVSDEARERMMIMEQTTDGFKIAEKDLELRGPGEFLGRRQSGLAGFRMANLIRDIDILQQAREAAFAILRSDPQLERQEHRALRDELLRSHGPAALTTSG
ncbi:MAG: ATP-dependent DNA helicase RecG [Bdellovibrionaceae bacterium]|nr:ATP-dependent DNA helicase RecG [Pseudobdellovibrionaceae bacterium]